MSGVIDISGYDKAEVLVALYTHARVQGLGAFRATDEPLTKEQANHLISTGERPDYPMGYPSGDRIYFDYLHGRVMKVDLSSDELDPALYDRDNGEGAAARAIATII